ncbi:hypothetical protein ASPACDRAFT_56050 [Aspergillus aculeatus ATCC 16872]|uniref:Oxidoreductase acuF-like C2H2 type zinc-finger domain-containing protein n=1 Tax=Aspergillus aculeatus (strain ATCC 16872 / CBS 172.66 / WB 5094) TaxID=690307 RepID=A0A1L9X8C4_ASPA1|nr:uncharacterized protein ASPACDRAFT_56050 [Aspergillus aculeatus ATCC 16872]OJK04584.1 hypothetical protein ASPACDRAFT_56050 [Aspergillus aculeatus ATCC 16872]
MDPPGQASLVEIAYRAPHAFHVHRVQFAAWLEHWCVFETDRVDMTLDYQVRNKLEVQSELYSGLRLMLLKILSCFICEGFGREEGCANCGMGSDRLKLRKALKVVETVEALEVAVIGAAVAAMRADEGDSNSGSGGGSGVTGWCSSDSSEAADLDAEFAEAPRHRDCEDPFTNLLKFCRYDLWHAIRTLDRNTTLFAQSSMYAPSDLLVHHPNYIICDEWDRDVTERFEAMVCRALRYRCKVHNKVLQARLAKMVSDRRRALNYHSRSQDDSPMHIPRQNLNPVTFVLAMRDAAQEEHPPPPPLAPGQEEFACPYCRYKLPAARYASHDAWRKHVLTDLEPYICIFDACTEETNTFRTLQQWLYHMEVHHSSTWICRVPRCRNRTFYRQIAFEQHGINAHGYTSESLKTICHESRRPYPAIFHRCPFCGPRPDQDPPRDDDAYLGNAAAHHAAHRLYHHVARHLEEFALLAIPYAPSEPVVYPTPPAGGGGGGGGGGAGGAGGGRYSRHILPIPRVEDHGNWEWIFDEHLPAYMYRRDVYPGSSRSSVSAASTPYYRPSTPVDGPDISELVDVVESEDAELFEGDEDGVLEGFDEFLAGVAGARGLTGGSGES